MNFTDFQEWRQACLQRHPEVLDCGETNLYRALSDWRLAPVDADARAGGARIYRCDLSRLWLARFAFSEAQSRRALVCRGVRHALRLIFRQLAVDKAKLWLPQDVYPLYLSLAKEHGLSADTYPTLPCPTLPQLASPSGERDEYILVCNPLKPLGRHLSPTECAHLQQWLHESPRRHLLLDCVYDMAAPLHESTLALEATGQAVILHSLTKGWLWPETFGITLFPEALQSRFEMAFKNDPPSQGQLAQAHACFSTASNRPDEIAGALQNRAQHLTQSLPPSVVKACVLPWDTSTPGRYMFTVDIPSRTLLEEHRVLGIPASVFGSSDWNGSILTSLAPSFHSPCAEPTHAA